VVEVLEGSRRLREVELGVLLRRCLSLPANKGTLHQIQVQQDRGSVGADNGQEGAGWKNKSRYQGRTPADGHAFLAGDLTAVNGHNVDRVAICGVSGVGQSKRRKGTRQASC